MSVSRRDWFVRNIAPDYDFSADQFWVIENELLSFLTSFSEVAYQLSETRNHTLCE